MVRDGQSMQSVFDLLGRNEVPDSRVGLDTHPEPNPARCAMGSAGYAR